MDLDMEVDNSFSETGMQGKAFSSLYVKSIDEEARRITAVASTGAVDRDSEIVEPEAFKGRLKRYMANPVVLAGHMHRLSDGRSPIVANVVEAKVGGKGLTVVMEFHCKTELSREYWGALQVKSTTRV